MRGGRLAHAAAEEASPLAPEADVPQQAAPTASLPGAKGEVAQLALLARLRGCGREAGQRKRHIVNGLEARDLVLWALEVNQRGPTGAGERPPPIHVNVLARRFCAGLAGLFAFVALLALVRGQWRELAAQDGMLLASGTPAYVGEEPVASLAAAVHRRSLLECAALPAAALQGARDVSLQHQGTWYSMRVVHLQKFSGSHLWMQAADGTGVRVRDGKVYFRRGMLGDEELVDSMDMASGVAAAYFEVVSPSDRAS